MAGNMVNWTSDPLQEVRCANGPAAAPGSRGLRLVEIHCEMSHASCSAPSVGTMPETDNSFISIQCILQEPQLAYMSCLAPANCVPVPVKDFSSSKCITRMQ
ncbi:unnamed protein product [Durusdinium trenchii]|uniref:Uncharacterized protein n=1 Tax=Durusdinium trenchii TaxID=1381693 RepID=A0ABP0NL90_9DINO